MTVHRKVSVKEAETIALGALAFLASENERLARFLSMSGLQAHNVRAAARAPGFLAAVLDYVASDEPLLIALADHLKTKPEMVMAARFALSPSEFD
jgi:chromosome segregation ATPase